MVISLLLKCLRKCITFRITYLKKCSLILEGSVLDKKIQKSFGRFFFPHLIFHVLGFCLTGAR